MKKALSALSLFIFALPAYSAVAVDLSQKSADILTTSHYVEKSRIRDFNHTLHIRIKQIYQGYPVWNGDAIIHIPNSGKQYVTGNIYQHLTEDLQSVPAYVFSDNQAQLALKHMLSLAHVRKNQVEKIATELMVFVDENNKANWAFKVSFLIPQAQNVLPKKPVYIINASDFTIYEEWDDIRTRDDVKAGGFIGNHKTGQRSLDGINGNPQPMNVQRDPVTGICYMRNKNLYLINARDNNIMTFSCSNTDPEHNNIYWNGAHDKFETTWSPSNDVMFGLEVTRSLYNDWYNLPMLVKNGEPMFLPVVVHDSITNAYWDGEQAVFGDSEGSDEFNPFTQLDTVAHEISHGFTEQHSELVYSGQSGGLNEAFSDMVGIAAEYYVYGTTQFLVGWGDVKANDKALRYMDKPSRDCDGGKPGNDCSIDHISQYKQYLNVHYSSGIYNRVYYLLANTANWNAKKALDVMVQANAHYWISNTSFEKAACDVMRATRDYNYNEKDVAAAFAVVGIDVRNCS